MGNFDADLIQYRRLNSVADLCNIFLSQGLYPLSTKPTCTAAVSSTLINNILNYNINCISLAALTIKDVFDHYPIFLQKLNSHKHRNPIVITYRIYSDRNIQNVRDSKRL